METIYATADYDEADGLKVAQNATIYKFTADTEAEAKGLALRHLSANCSYRDEYCKLAPADFGDCWIKAYGNNPPDIRPFDLDEMIVQGPGSHPGGNCTWYSPLPTVYLLRVELDD